MWIWACETWTQQVCQDRDMELQRAHGGWEKPRRKCARWKSAESGDGGQAEGEAEDEGDGNTPSTRRSLGRIVGNGRWDADALPLGAPDLEDTMRRNVADAIRDMFRSYAENGNGALRRVLRDEASSWPAVPGPDAVDNVGGSDSDLRRRG